MCAQEGSGISFLKKRPGKKEFTHEDELDAQKFEQSENLGAYALVVLSVWLACCLQVGELLPLTRQTA